MCVDIDRSVQTSIPAILVDVVLDFVVLSFLFGFYKKCPFRKAACWLIISVQSYVERKQCPDVEWLVVCCIVFMLCCLCTVHYGSSHEMDLWVDVSVLACERWLSCMRSDQGWRLHRWPVVRVCSVDVPDCHSDKCRKCDFMIFWPMESYLAVSG